VLALLKGLLEPEVKHRLSAKEALRMPLFTGLEKTQQDGFAGELVLPEHVPEYWTNPSQ
jgi:hypothetical protein